MTNCFLLFLSGGSVASVSRNSVHKMILHLQKGNSKLRISCLEYVGGDIEGFGKKSSQLQDRICRRRGKLSDHREFLTRRLNIISVSSC